MVLKLPVVGCQFISNLFQISKWVYCAGLVHISSTNDSQLVCNIPTGPSLLNWSQPQRSWKGKLLYKFLMHTLTLGIYCGLAAMRSQMGSAQWTTLRAQRCRTRCLHCHQDSRRTLRLAVWCCPMHAPSPLNTEHSLGILQRRGCTAGSR